MTKTILYVLLATLLIASVSALTNDNLMCREDSIASFRTCYGVQFLDFLISIFA